MRPVEKSLGDVSFRQCIGASGFCGTTAHDDAESRALIAKIGKKCPACGMFMEKNQGCSHMKCGTRASGSDAEALRNGGCAHEFDWHSMTPIRNGRPGEPHNERQVLFARLG